MNSIRAINICTVTDAGKMVMIKLHIHGIGGKGTQVYSAELSDYITIGVKAM